MDRRLSYFVSDVHLGLDVADPKGREERFVRLLRSIDPAQTENLFLLGDVWDFWYEYRDVVPKGYVQVFAALQDLMAAGVNVVFFQGNHDVWTYDYFESMGMKKMRQPALVRIGGKAFCLGHGDGLGPVSGGYRLLRSIFHSRACQFLFSLLHPWLAFRLGCSWSKNSRLGRREEYVFRGLDEPICMFAKDYAAAHEVDYFVFGHFHVSVDMPLGEGPARLMILKDWMQSSPYLLFDSESGTISSCSLETGCPLETGC